MFAECLLNLTMLAVAFQWVFSLIAWLGPHPIHQRSLLNLSPVNNATLPTIVIGMWGSCVKNTSGGYKTICTKIKSGNYSLENLPDDTSRAIVKPPHTTLGLLIGFSVAFSIVFFLAWWIFLDSLPFVPGQGLLSRGKAFFMEHIVFGLLPFTIFLLGAVPFLTVQMIFRQTCDDFNDYSKFVDKVDFVASVGNGFLLAWVGSGMTLITTIVCWMHAHRAKPSRVRYGSIRSFLKGEEEEEHWCLYADYANSNDPENPKLEGEVLARNRIADENVRRVRDEQRRRIANLDNEPPAARIARGAPHFNVDNYLRDVNTPLPPFVPPQPPQ